MMNTASSPSYLFRTGALLAALTLSAAAAIAGDVEVVAVDVSAGAGGDYRFDVTLRHADTGWEHYADQWQVLGPDGAVLGTRTLYHPHVNEQPFTRSLSGVRIPPGVDRVSVRGRDSEHGYGAEFSLSLD